MSKVKVVFRCADCGALEPKWAGRCAACGAWNSLAEEVEQPRSRAGMVPARDQVEPIAEVDLSQWEPVGTGVAELDRVLGGGIVPGSVTVCGGEPGIGKSTLLLQAAAGVAGQGDTALYVSGEESKAQVRMRAERLGALRPRLLLVSEYSIDNVLAHVAAVEPDLLIIDSIQTLHDPEIPSAPGSVVQVRECASRLVQEAKARGMSVVLVGHVTKEGGLAGPRTLEHLVDTVLSFEGDRHHALRVLRAVKHRFGSTLDVGLFEMSEQGLNGVPDPSELFLADRRRGVAGSVVVPTIDGQRPLLVEVQALVTPSPYPTPRRSVQGVDGRRLALLLAVLGRRAGIWCNQHDVYGLAVGGAQVVEPGADLGLALAIASAVVDRPVPEDLVAVGEVGLAGELRQVGHMPRRLAEAARMGFRKVIVPFTSPAAADGLAVIRAGTLSEALLAVGCRP